VADLVLDHVILYRQMKVLESTKLCLNDTTPTIKVLEAEKKSGQLLLQPFNPSCQEVSQSSPQISRIHSLVLNKQRRSSMVSHVVEFVPRSDSWQCLCAKDEVYDCKILFTPSNTLIIWTCLSVCLLRSFFFDSVSFVLEIQR